MKKTDHRLDHEVYLDFEERLIESSQETFLPGELLDFRLVPQSVLYRELKDMSEAHLDIILDELWKYPDDERTAPVLELIGFIVSSRVATEVIEKLRIKR